MLAHLARHPRSGRARGGEGEPGHRRAEGDPSVVGILTKIPGRGGGEGIRSSVQYSSIGRRIYGARRPFARKRLESSADPQTSEALAAGREL
jgi:hypothetical protein